MSDTDLVRRFLAYQAEFLGYAMAITRDLDASEEILQEVAVILLEGRRPETIADFRAWAKEVVRRQSLAWLRSHIGTRRRQASPALLSSLEATFAEDDGAGVVQAELEALRGCLQRLSARAREVLSARYQERASFEVIAERLRATAPAVQRSLHRIRLALRDCVTARVRSA